MNNATVEEQNFVMEKVNGAASRSIMKWLRSTSGVDRVSVGWTRECNTVGMKRAGGQR